MDPCELTLVITALANAIAKNIDDNACLDVLSAVFTQLGDTLSTISMQRAYLKNMEDDTKSPANTEQQ